jgi:hypothetical protein
MATAEETAFAKIPGVARDSNLRRYIVAAVAAALKPGVDVSHFPP